MSLHISRFLDRVRTAESKQQREIVITLNEARDLHTDITRLLLTMESLREKMAEDASQNTITDITIDGGKF